MPCLEYRELRCGKNCAVNGACREPVGSAGVCPSADLCAHLLCAVTSACSESAGNESRIGIQLRSQRW